MNAWLLPGAAGAFWAGLLLWESRPAGISGWVVAIVGAASLVAAVLAAPRITDRDRLAGAGIARPDAEAVLRVAPVRRVQAGATRAALLLAVLGISCLGAAWGALGQARLEGSVIARLGEIRITALGTLREDPASGAFGWHGVVDLSRVSWPAGAAALRETVWVNGNGPPPRVVRGDAVRVEGVLQRPGDPEFAEVLRHRGIIAELNLDTFARIGPAPNPVVRATQAFRRFAAGSILRFFPQPEAGLLLGLALGDASHLEPGLARDFQATGLGHLLVVSGENVAMVLAPVMALGALLRLTRWPRFALALGTVGCFVLLTGAEPSVMRAGVMATLGLFGVLMGKPRGTATLLSGAIFVLLTLDPWLVWSIGFQLSVAATAGMVAFGTPMAERLARAMPRPAAFAFGASLAAQLGVTPLLLYHFHEVPLITIPANLAAFPAVSPALLLGLLAALIGLAWYPAGRVVAGLALVPLRWLEGVANRLAKAPVSHLTSGGGPGVLVIGTAVFVGTAWWVRTRWRPPRAAVVAAVALFPVLIWSTALSSGPPSGLTVRFFDVGQGDAALVSTPAGVHILVDGGPDDELVATDLAAQGVKRLDVVIATHPHADHIIGLPVVLARFPVGVVLEPGCPDTSSIQADLDTSIGQEHVPVRYPRLGDTFTVGDVRLDVLSPDRCWVETNSDPNNDSLVVLLTYRQDTVLLGGEPEEPAQQQLLDEGAPLHAELLKVPHHGAATSLPEFFQAVAPKIAVISVGPNTYGHPVPSTIAAIEATGAQVWRTDQHGDIVVLFGPRGPTVSSDR
ncbi:MAG: DNA internalization-related competence protein ComEC/Rec2 [Actinomycetota bacterium]